jgi:hypothetical protein
MTAGAVVLMVLGHNPPSAGPFCLSTYYRLGPIDDVLRSRAGQTKDRWNNIEIFFSGTRSGSLEQLAATHGETGAADLNCHFVLCNGNGGRDGEVQATEKWQKQWSITPSPAWQGSQRTIRICLVGDGVSTRPTDYQLKRLEMLLEALCRKFHIPAESVYLPRDCE